MSESILIVGHGYFGGHLSKLVSRDTFRIFATTRNPAKVKDLESAGLNAIQFDVLNQSATPIEESFDNIVYCVGYDRRQNASRHDVYVGGLQNFLSKLSCPPKRFIYISSTGVYGQSDGQWVNEKSETVPTREGGQACLAAENLLEKVSTGDQWNREKQIDSKPTRTTVMRLAGIYGPDRIPNRAKLEQGSLSMNANGYLNLIHVSDAARICQLFIEADLTQSDSAAPLYSVFNVSDGNPATRGEFYSCLASKLGVEPPALEGKSESSPSRQDGSKRVENRKLIQETGYEFRFPSYESGLAHILQS